MIKQNIPRILIGAGGSGCGKTTFTCGLLRALHQAGRRPVSFKCGPDYIDPMFHTEVLGIPSRNLDLFFTEENTVNYLLAKHSKMGDMVVMEGVMGYYDGLAGISSEASSFHLARATKTPALLLVDGRGKSLSLLAEIKGFLEFTEDSRISGVILNRISPMMYPELKAMIEDRLGVRVYGYIPKMDDCSLESRHLGLVTAKEIKDLQAIINRLAEQIKESVDLEAIIRLAEGAVPVACRKPELPAPCEKRISIGVARDNAFCFYYEDNLELLRELGADLVFFSPISDRALPEGISGLMLGGGYPELYLSQLAANETMRTCMKKAIEGGMPCMAECGGFMYLHDRLGGRDGSFYPMVGAIDGQSYPTKKLGRFGYITLTANHDNLLCRAGQQLKGHEFHYWDSTAAGDAFYAEKPLRSRSWECIHGRETLFAGYPHVYFYSNPQAAKNFLNACMGYESGNGTR